MSDTAIDITDVAEIQSAASLRAASALDIWHSDEQIEDFLAHRDAVGWCEALLALPPIDACWVLAGLLPREQRQIWADTCARRARDYAAGAGAAADARADAHYAAAAARTARAAGAGAAADAYYAAAADVAADAYYAAATAAAARSAGAGAAGAGTGARFAARSAADAAHAAYYAAAAAAADADAGAAADAAMAAEYRTAIRHGVALLGAHAPEGVSR